MYENLHTICVTRFVTNSSNTYVTNILSQVELDARLVERLKLSQLVENSVLLRPADFQAFWLLLKPQPSSQFP